jgi:hypothetical protein
MITLTLADIVEVIVEKYSNFVGLLRRTNLRKFSVQIDGEGGFFMIFLPHFHLLIFVEALL